jgi:hypothetical protein
MEYGVLSRISDRLFFPATCFYFARPGMRRGEDLMFSDNRSTSGFPFLEEERGRMVNGEGNCKYVWLAWVFEPRQRKWKKDGVEADGWF